MTLPDKTDTLNEPVNDKETPQQQAEI